MSFQFPNNPTPQELLALYEDGLQGAPIDHAEHEQLFAGGWVLPGNFISDLVRSNPGNNKRALLWRSREKFDPGAFSQESQTANDCTSHGDRNARDVTRSVEIDIKGEAESYYKRGATEPSYAYRGYTKDSGMAPSRAAKFVTAYGWMARQNYEGCVDLTKYNSSIGVRLGRSGPTKCMLEHCKQHSVGKYVTPDTADEAIALFQNGYACHSGQNVGFSSSPNSQGIHERRGSWNHDMATVGYDDTKEIWDRRVYFVVNSWGNFNRQWGKWLNDSNLKSILGFPINGMIVVDASVWERYFLGGGSIYFYSDVTGFPAKNLPDYGTGDFL